MDEAEHVEVFFPRFLPIEKSSRFEFLFENSVLWRLPITIEGARL